MSNNHPIEDLTAPISAAVALGLNIPAPTGTYLYATFKPSDGVDTFAANFNLSFLGVHSTLTSAISTLAAEVKRMWTFDNSHFERRNTPWMTEELYEQATNWRRSTGPNNPEQQPLTESDITRLLTEATEALTTIRELENEWFNTHTDLETVWTYLQLGDYNPTLDEIEQGDLLHPWIQYATVKA